MPQAFSDNASEFDDNRHVLLKDHTMSDKITGDAAKLASALTLHFQTLGKYWGFAATVTFVAFTAAPADGVVELLGFKLKEADFYPTCAVFGAILNFAYCISHLQAYRTAEIFRSYAKSISINQPSFVDDISIEDAVHALYASAINRVYPITHSAPKLSNNRFVKRMKLLVDLFVFAVPIFGSVYATSHLPTTWWAFPILVLVAISLLMSLLLATTGFSWTLKWIKE